MQREINPQDPRDVSRGAALTEIPLNAVIQQPAPAQVMPAGPVHMYGWAVGAGGRSLTAVEVFRCGQEWMPARIVTAAAGWAWSRWEATVNLPRGRHTLVVRATDTAGRAQPANVNATWNVKGYNNNAWHRVTVDLV